MVSIKGCLRHHQPMENTFFKDGDTHTHTQTHKAWGKTPYKAEKDSEVGFTSRGADFEGSWCVGMGRRNLPLFRAGQFVSSKERKMIHSQLWVNVFWSSLELVGLVRL